MRLLAFERARRHRTLWILNLSHLFSLWFPRMPPGQPVKSQFAKLGLDNGFEMWYALINGPRDTDNKQGGTQDERKNELDG